MKIKSEIEKVLITNKTHPHYDEIGEIVLNENGNVQLNKMFGKEMFKIKLIGCKHGVDECFVSVKDVKLI